LTKNYMAEKKFSDPLGRGAGRQNAIPDSKRAKPMAPLAFSDKCDIQLNRAKGWLENKDSFFDTIGRIVKDRTKHVPRVLKKSYRTINLHAGQIF